MSEEAKKIFFEAVARCRVSDAMRGMGDLLKQEMASARRLVVVAVGKGGAGMLTALLALKDELGWRETVGVLVSPEAMVPMPAGVRYFQGEHPQPGESSRAAARTILSMLEAEPASAETYCVFLISGGASAMVELPLDEGISVEETRVLYRELVLSGAGIAEINCVRKHFSAVKGGRLGLRAGHLRQMTLLMSDVPVGQEDSLGSGPTVPDRSTVAECLEVLDRYELWGRLPGRVAEFFRSEGLVETLKPGAMKGRAVVLLGAGDLARHAGEAAREMGYEVVFEDGFDEWGYRETADYLLQRMRGLRGRGRRVCLISVGEVLVRVQTEGTGRAVGGRNQHTALYAAMRMDARDAGIAMLSCGSDGVDGNSAAAGAVVDWSSCGSRAGFAEKADEALRGFASYGLLKEMGCCVETGPTGINLRDLRVLIAQD